jgi:hypothetical protein
MEEVKCMASHPCHAILILIAFFLLCRPKEDSLQPSNIPGGYPLREDIAVDWGDVRVEPGTYNYSLVRYY